MLRFWKKVRKTDCCWIWTGAVSSNGYGHIGIDGKMILAHRASYALKNGEIKKGLQVNHHCDNKLCVNPEHLYAGTQKQNIADCISRGRFNKPKGSAHWNYKGDYRYG